MFAILAILQLSLGIGGMITVHAILNSLVLRPLPFKSQDRLIMLWEDNHEKNLTHQRVAPDKFRDWQKELITVQQLTAYQVFDAILTPSSQPQRVQWTRVSGNFFDTFQLKPVLGRTLLPSDTDDAIVISSALWKRRFGSQDDIVGSVVAMNDRYYVVVGIINASSFPANGDVWTLLPASWSSRVAHSLFVVGILQPRYDLADCRSELAQVSQRARLAYPDTDADWGATAILMRDEMLGDSKQAIELAWGAALLVLLIACFNIANLMSVRLRTRFRELAIKMVLGANHPQLLLSLLGEPLLLSCCATLTGLLLARIAMKLPIAILSSESLRDLPHITIDWHVALLSIGVLVFSVILSGGLTALQVPQIDPMRILKEENATGTRKHRISQMLVIVEISLSVCILLFNGQAVGSLLKLQHTDPGFRVSQLSIAEFGLPKSEFPAVTSRATFIHLLVASANRLPVVIDAAVTSRMPLGGASEPFNFIIDGQPAFSHSDMKSAEYRAVSPGFLRMMGIPLIRGRYFEDSDNLDSPKVLLINAAMAHRYWPTDNPIDKQISIDGPQGPWRRVIGIVGDTREDGLDRSPTAEMYFPIPQEIPWTLALVVRSRAGHLVSSDFRKIFAETGANVFAYKTETAEELVSDALSTSKGRGILLTSCSLVGTILAVVGIYSFLAYVVSQRESEIGLKMALGATPFAIGTKFATEGLSLLLFGIGSGLSVGLLIAKALSIHYYGMSLLDATNILTIILGTFLVGITAVLVPSVNASRVEPAVALRRN
jgi:predicted permease